MKKLCIVLLVVLVSIALVNCSKECSLSGADCTEMLEGNTDVSSATEEECNQVNTGLEAVKLLMLAFDSTATVDCKAEWK